MELKEHRPWVPQITLERDVPLPLYSDQYVMLWGLCKAPLLQQAVRWKTTPMGWDAAGQSWSTGLSSRDEEPEAPWYTLAADIAHRRWQWFHAARREFDLLPAAYAQRLREVAWWDPMVPSMSLGHFLWQERPVVGKEYVVTRSQSPGALGRSSGYVPGLSFCCPLFTTKDVRTWSRLHHQPSTHQ